MLRFRVLYLLVILCQGAFAQNPQSTAYPESYFRYPLDLPPILSGNFGELRSNHFHSGLDFKTNQREGYPIYAPADGYVSRIRVQIGGGGTALYITHPNGYTSVYMHLRGYNERISQTLKTYQYRKEVYDIDFPLLPVEIPVKKGELIAWSGNTGGSNGPHLHFEIRDTRTEETINPQLFGITVPDRVRPAISGLYLYHLNGEPFSEHTPKQFYPVSGSAGKYQLNPAVTVNIGDEAGFGIMTIDKNSASDNTTGPYSIEFRLDGQPIYASVWEKFSFANSRALNSHLDYPALISTGRRIQKSFIEPGNPLQIYKARVNNGLIRFSDTEIHDMQYIVRDIAGNESILNFKARYNPSAVRAPKKPMGRLFRFDQVNELDTNGMRARIPAGALYSDLNLVYSSSAAPVGAYSRVHHVHNRLIPTHIPYTLSIKADVSLPAHLTSKVLLVNSSRVAQGGTYEGGSVKAEVRAFGSFYIAADTIPPRITALNISEGVSFPANGRIRFKISDNLSGIRSFTGRINGKWVLMEYDSKTASLWHTLDDKTAAGQHEFELSVSDMKANTSVFRARFFR